MPEPRTILVAVTDGVLADSLCFSLELEGFEAKLCDERSLLPAISARQAPGCVVLDQDVFVRMVDGKLPPILAELGVPVVLMVGHGTKRVVEQAKAAGVTKVVEKPLLGGVLFEAIRNALRSGPAFRSCGDSPT